MLSRKVFDDGIEEIENVFDNFAMTKTKGDIWYKYCNHLSDNDFKNKVQNAIRGCRRNPTLADIIDWKGYFIDGKLDDDIKSMQKERQWEQVKKDEKIPPRSRKMTILTLKTLAKFNPDYNNKLKELEEKDV
jgi:hypothetical protein